MTYPTPLSAWYVVARIRTLDNDGLEYYTTLDADVDGPPKFTQNKRDALLIPNLRTAEQIKGNDPDTLIIVLCSKAAVKEFGR